MKPIIIGVTKDGKVDMTLDEFRKHVDDAYWQGYRDNTSSLIATNGSDKWWNTTPYVDTPLSNLFGTVATSANTATTATNGKEG